MPRSLAHAESVSTPSACCCSATITTAASRTPIAMHLLAKICTSAAATGLSRTSKALSKLLTYRLGYSDPNEGPRWAWPTSGRSPDLHRRRPPFTSGDLHEHRCRSRRAVKTDWASALVRRGIDVHADLPT